MTDARETLLAQVSDNGRALQHATVELRGDREIAMQAVTQCGHALCHVTEELKGGQRDSDASSGPERVCSDACHRGTERRPRDSDGSSVARRGGSDACHQGAAR